MEVFGRRGYLVPNCSMRMAGLVASVLRPQIGEIDERGRRWRAIYGELEGLLKDIEEALQAKNKGLAKRLLRKLASKKLSHTPAAEQAKERYKDL